ncbi:unnamed protein product [Rotaria sp. Silwood1]|nr:unnamed protein product [Rotaria sp. Silwood1]CAF4969002.1 unnamed protein product [Rotaria sp. Silwood1]
MTSNSDIAYADNKRWEQLISCHMPNLRIFDIRHEVWPKHADNNQLMLDTQINPFTSSFWIERKWFFTYQFRQSRFSDYTIFYSTNPYRRRTYILYEQSAGKICLNTEKTILNSVRHVYVQNEKGVINCMNYFPNATELTLKYNMSVCRDSILKTIKNILPVQQLTKLVIETHYFSLIKISKLLYFMPNIQILALKSIPLYGYTYEDIEKNKIFQIVSNRNTIRDVTLEETSTLDKIQLLLKLCPRMQHLSLETRAKNLKAIIRLLFDETNRNVHPLNSLCLLGASECWQQKIYRLVQSENLNITYTVKYIRSNLWLWW